MAPERRPRPRHRTTDVTATPMGRMALALSLLLLGGCPPVRVEPKPVPATCEQELRGRIDAWLGEGRLDRARRGLESVEGECPRWEPERRRALLQVLHDLGDVEAFVALKTRMVAQGATGLPEAPSEEARPVAELRTGLVALREGRRAEARRMLDRARVGFRRKGMTEALVVLRLGPRIDESEHLVAFTAEDALQPARPRPRVAPISGPFAVFDRASSEPRYLLEGNRLSLLGDEVVTWLGPLRLVDDRGVIPISDDGFRPVATHRGIAFVERTGADLRVVLYDPSTRRRVEQESLPAPSLPTAVSTDGRHLCFRFAEERVAFDLQPWRRLPAADDATCPPSSEVLPGPRREGPTLEVLKSPNPRPEVTVAQATIAWASAASSEPFLRVWSMRDGWRLRSTEAHCRPALDAQGDTVAAARCGEEDEVLVYRLDTGEHRTQSLGFRIEGLTLSAHGERLLAWGAEEVALLEPFAGGQVAWSAPSPVHRRAVMAPDGSSLVVTVPGGFDLRWLPDASPTPEEPVVFSIPCPEVKTIHYVDAHTVQCGRQLVDLRRPRAVPHPALPPRPRLIVDEGQVALLDAAGRRLGSIQSDGQGGAFALMTDGTLDPMGDHHPALHCRYGHLLAPLVVCGDRWLVEGALRRAWSAP